MRRPKALDPRLNPPTFAVREAAALGLDLERMRRSDLGRPFRGVRETVPADDLVGLCRRLHRVLRPDAYICGPTAALLWGIPLPRRLETAALHVGHPHGQRPTRLPGTIGHHFVITPAELTAVHGIPVTSPARTWCDLAGLLTLEELVAAGDRVLWRRDPLATITELAELAERHPGRRGRAARRAALPLLTDRADSSPESIYRIRFLHAGLPEVTPNFEVRRADGTLVAAIDLAFVKYRVGHDHEGDHHRTDRAQWRKDLRRFPTLENMGWSMVRSSGDDLADSGALIENLRLRLRHRGWEG